MAAPIRGPFTETVNTTPIHKYKVWYRSAKPYDTVLDHTYTQVYGDPDPEIGYGATRVGGDLTTFIQDPVITLLRNKAYDRLKDQVSDPASTLVSVAQLNQSCDMIMTRAIQLRRFMSRLRKGDLYMAYNEFRDAITRGSKFKIQPKAGRDNWEVVRDGKVRDVAKDLASLWLEWSFGWAPLLNDMQSAYDVIGRDPPPQRVYASASASSTFEYNPTRTEIPGYKYYFVPKYNIRQSIRCGALFKVDNPNLYLYNQLGIANPLPAIWDLIPWSFVVDWVTNASDFLNQGSDLWGLSHKMAYTSERSIGNLGVTKTVIDTRGGANYVFNGGESYDFKRVKRGAGLPSVAFVVRPVWITSWKRAANAISLLVQKLP